jgi:cytochrome c-type biogenesis protein CcmH/NrfG
MRAAVLTLAAALVVLSAASGGARSPAVRVWQSTLVLPTTLEGPPNPNPPFDLFSPARVNYPYTIRDTLLDRQEPQAWRSLHLENEYLRLTVLPDLGGHVYGLLDKVSGRDVFYANRSIKKALIGYRGAWAAFGVEFNFPVSHNWVSMSPVDFATAAHADGSGSIWVGNIDAVFGSSWQVELRLRPGEALLEQQVTLRNRSDARHRYYWWTNAAVEAWDDSELVYPTAFMATHGFTRIQPWPRDADGRDLSRIRNQTDGPVSLFTYGTREPFVGVYHPHTNTGTVHVASPAELPTHKVWSWGFDADAMGWREALSDDNSAYVELQAGLFRNQETYGFLDPQEAVRFTEYWLPVREIGGLTRATTGAVFHGSRSGASATFGLNVTRALPGARVSIRQGSRPLWQAQVSLTPGETWRHTVGDLSAEPWTFVLAEASGTKVLAHTEGVYDLTPAERVPVGPQPTHRAPPAADRGDGGVFEVGTRQELDGKRLRALDTYRQGLARFPSSLLLQKAAGRLATSLGWAAADWSEHRGALALNWLRRARERDPADAETSYYLGLALAAAAELREARAAWEAAQRFRATRAAASLQLARLAARDGDLPAALTAAAVFREAAPGSPLAAGLEAACLRLAGRPAAAAARVTAALTHTPTSSLLRYERTRLGDEDPALWPHLAAEPNRILDLVDQYLLLGAYADALDLLQRQYPQVPGGAREPGAVAPEKHPLIAYYRGFVRERMGDSGRADYAAAGRLPLDYVFPNRHSTYAVLHAALRANPDDHAARFLLGSLYLSSGLVDEAIEAWQRVRRARPSVPTLHRSLALALLHGPGDERAARAVLEEGLAHDASNVEVYLTLDGVLSAAGVAPAVRLEALRRYPATDRLPGPLVYAQALALAEAGEGDAAETLLRTQYVPREEGGTSGRAVYVQVRLLRARQRAEQGACDDARVVVATLDREVPGMPLTQGGLAGVARTPPVQWQLARIGWICARDGEARVRLERLADWPGENAGAMRLALAADAARLLGRPFEPHQLSRIEKELASLDDLVDSGEGGGMALWIRGLLLQALGRDEDARAAWRRVLHAPDRNLSHQLARTALRAGAPESAR